MIHLARIGRHGLAIGVVGAALVGASFSRPVAAVQTISDTDTDPPASPSPAVTEAALSLLALPTPAPVADQVYATVTFDPRVGLPQWLRAVRDLELWSSADTGATSSG